MGIGQATQLELVMFRRQMAGRLVDFDRGQAFRYCPLMHHDIVELGLDLVGLHGASLARAFAAEPATAGAAETRGIAVAEGCGHLVARE
jgi:hypothetical protein